MKNKIEDLRNHMFTSLERLNDEDITPENLQKEIARSKAIAGLGKVLVDSAKAEVDFLKATKSEGQNSKFLGA